MLIKESKKMDEVKCSTCKYVDRDGREQPCMYCLEHYIKSKEFKYWKKGEKK